MKPRILSFSALLSIPLVLHAGQQADQQVPAAPPTPPPMTAQAATTHVVLQDADLKWGEAPPAFERGAQFAVLSGDPGKAGLFVIRIKAPPGFRIANHWHPSDEHVTLLDG
ncbi:MAG: cupin domain-containing protein, partial [Luteimonas sp.]